MSLRELRSDMKVLGSIGSLVSVENDQAARLLAWQLGSKMRVIVTTTREDADQMALDHEVLCLSMASKPKRSWPRATETMFPAAEKYGGKYLLDFVTFPVSPIFIVAITRLFFPSELGRVTAACERLTPNAYGWH